MDNNLKIEKLNYDTIKEYEVPVVKPYEASMTDFRQIEHRKQMLEMLNSFTVLLSKKSDDTISYGTYAFTKLVDKRGYDISNYQFEYFYNFYYVLAELTSFDSIDGKLVFDEDKKLLLPITSVLELMKLSKDNANGVNELLLKDSSIDADKLLIFQRAISSLNNKEKAMLTKFSLKEKNATELGAQRFEENKEVNDQYSIIPVMTDDIKLEIQNKKIRK